MNYFSVGDTVKIRDIIMKEWLSKTPNNVPDWAHYALECRNNNIKLVITEIRGDEIVINNDEIYYKSELDFIKHDSRLRFNYIVSYNVKETNGYSQWEKSLK